MDWFGYKTLDPESHKKYQDFYMQHPEKFHWNMDESDIPISMLYGRKQRQKTDPEHEDYEYDPDFLENFLAKVWGWENTELPKPEVPDL